MAGRSQFDFARYRPFLFPGMVVLCVVGLVVWAASDPLGEGLAKTPDAVSEDVGDVVSRANAHLEKRWATAKLDRRDKRTTPVEPVNAADDLTVFRRLSLALHGTVPSLEDIRAFQKDDKPQRLERWTERMLQDTRFADYFAERLARSYVSTDPGTFVIYRRDRFVQWLQAQLRENRPYDAMVRDIIAEQGLWTGTPATNFMTAAFNDGKFDVNKLTGRTVRAFLGQRLDCAQCHDHPFVDQWKQHHFEGLAAFYAQSNLSVFGVEDKQQRKGETVEYMVTDRKTNKEKMVKPAVPFHPEWLSDDGTRRQRLAHWVTHHDNRRFTRATVNRVWALLFGRQYTYPHYPVDDIPNPDDPKELCDTKLLDIIGDDFRDHDYDLRRLILVITSTRPFRMTSELPFEPEVADSDQLKVLERKIKHHEDNWGVFPITQLRPEQVIRSMIQSASLQTIDQNSNLFVRFIRAIREKNFVEEYGDPGGDELTLSARTIPQSLLLMNGNLTRETTKPTPFTATWRIPTLSGSNDNCVETCFLTVLTRLPTDEERKVLIDRLSAEKNKDQRLRVVQDLYWSLFNSEEFSWNH